MSEDPEPSSTPAEPGPEPSSSVTPVDVEELHPCERSCAEVHDCARATGTSTPSAAAALELACVERCLATGQAQPLFGCAAPPTITVEACDPYLDCVREAWPGPVSGPGPAPPIPDGRGCERACEVFAACNNPDATPENIQRCVVRCERSLSEEQERAIGACTELGDCEQIEACVMAMPGA